MIPKLIEGFTRRLGPPRGRSSEECATLGIRDQDGDLGNEMWSAWEPTPEELEALKQGGSVFLKICGSAHPMVWIGAALRFDADNTEERATQIELEAKDPITSAGRLAKKLGEISIALQEQPEEVNLEELAAVLPRISDVLLEQSTLIKGLQGVQVEP